MYSYVLYGAYSLAAVIVYLVSSSIFSSIRHSAKAKKWGTKPAPQLHSFLPFGISNVLKAINADKEKMFPPMLVDRTKEVGASTYQYNILGTVNYLTTDPKNIQAILATQFEDFGLGEIRRAIFFPLLGNGIFTTDGKAWEHSRSLLRPQFARHQVGDLDLEELHVQNLMRALPVNPKTGWTDSVDLQVLFFRLTIDSATEFLFGESVDSQINELPENAGNPSKGGMLDEKEFAHAFDTGNSYLAGRARLQDQYWLMDNKEFRQCCKRVHAFVDYYVDLALKQPQSKDRSGKDIEKNPEAGKKEKYVFLEALAAETRDPIEIRSQLLNILLAGRDTTAGLLGWLFFHLVRHPQVWAKLRAIVLEDFGTYDRPRDITFARLKACTYLQYCLNEILRINPMVPLNSRKANKDTTIPRGGGPDGSDKCYVRKGQQVDYSVHVMHRRKDLWGQDADEFRPERWVGRKTGWEYLPFNGGPRICIGQQFALTEAGYVTVRMVQRFATIENMDTDPIEHHNLTLTSHTGNGVKVKLHIDSS